MNLLEKELRESFLAAMPEADRLELYSSDEKMKEYLDRRVTQAAQFIADMMYEKENRRALTTKS